MKKKITNQPILILLRREEKFRIKTNASRHIIREILSQKQEGKWKPIMFLSSIIQVAGKNYEICNKELLAIVETLIKWRQLLWLLLTKIVNSILSKLISKVSCEYHKRT